jgi:hypothetical protein
MLQQTRGREWTPLFLVCQFEATVRGGIGSLAYYWLTVATTVLAQRVVHLGNK